MNETLVKSTGNSNELSCLYLAVLARGASFFIFSYGNNLLLVFIV